MRLCELCYRLDFVSISQISVNEALGRLQTGHNLFYYIPGDDGLGHPAKKLIPYHKSLGSLRASAKLCDLCHLVQSSVEEGITAITTGREDGAFYQLVSFELFLGGRDADGPNGFQVIGYGMETRINHPMYLLLGSIGFCVKNGMVWAELFTHASIPKTDFDLHCHQAASSKL